ncbi:hypothetical protein ACLOJK_016697 [Asimina triloba]
MTSRFLGIPAEADLEEIKAAYRRLSKEYHPDTTSLPLKVASEKFMQLRQVYDVLSNEESRRFYDWTLAQEAASRQAEMMKLRLEDPYQQDVENAVPTPDMVDRLGGRNLELSDQAMAAIGFDAIIIFFAIGKGRMDGEDGVHPSGVEPTKSFSFGRSGLREFRFLPKMNALCPSHSHTSPKQGETSVAPKCPNGAHAQKYPIEECWLSTRKAMVEGCYLKYVSCGPRNYLTGHSAKISVNDSCDIIDSAVATAFGLRGFRLGHFNYMAETESFLILHAFFCVALA